MVRFFKSLTISRSDAACLPHGFSPRPAAPGGNMSNSIPVAQTIHWLVSPRDGANHLPRQLTGVSISSPTLRQLARIDLSNNSFLPFPRHLSNAYALSLASLSDNKIARIPAAIAEAHVAHCPRAPQQSARFHRSRHWRAVQSRNALARLCLLSASSRAPWPPHRAPLSPRLRQPLVSLPNEIGALTRLAELEVGVTSSSSCPTEIGRCRSLKVLYAHNNKLVSRCRFDDRPLPQSSSTARPAQSHRSLPRRARPAHAPAFVLLDPTTSVQCPTLLLNLTSLRQILLHRQSEARLCEHSRRRKLCVSTRRTASVKICAQVHELPPEQTTKPSSSASSSSADLLPTLLLLRLLRRLQHRCCVTFNQQCCCCRCVVVATNDPSNRLQSSLILARARTRRC
jgi:Leucine-rich repeat (LRR) protein